MSVTASHARAQLFPLIEQVNEDMEAVEIVSKKGTAFLVPAEVYRSLVETSYLLQSPANAAHLRASLSEARDGDLAARDLLPGVIRFTSRGWADYASWADDRKTLRRINRLIEEAARDPGVGVGKPERLSGDLSRCWSRRIDQEHRLVYTVADGEVVVVAARYHY